MGPPIANEVIRLPRHLLPEGVEATLRCGDAVAQLWKAAVAAIGGTPPAMVGHYLYDTIVGACDELGVEANAVVLRGLVPDEPRSGSRVERILSGPAWLDDEPDARNVWPWFRTTYLLLVALYGTNRTA